MAHKLDQNKIRIYNYSKWRRMNNRTKTAIYKIMQLKQAAMLLGAVQQQSRSKKNLVRTLTCKIMKLFRCPNHARAERTRPYHLVEC